MSPIINCQDCSLNHISTFRSPIRLDLADLVVNTGSSFLVICDLYRLEPLGVAMFLAALHMHVNRLRSAINSSKRRQLESHEVMSDPLYKMLDQLTGQRRIHELPRAILLSQVRVHLRGAYRLLLMEKAL